MNITLIESYLLLLCLIVILILVISRKRMLAIILIAVAILQYCLLHWNMLVSHLISLFR